MPAVIDIKRLLIVLACFAAAPLYAQQTSVDDIRKLAREGQLDAALEQIDQRLQRNPDERQMRFLKGVLLAEKKQAAKAIEVFRQLTVDYPDLPEPYNNLAVLYAAQGDYEKARDALLLAINTHPSYATAFENLGDIYAKMAGVAYDKALSIDASNTNAKHKLNLIDDLFVSAAGEPAAGVSAGTVTAPEPVAEPAGGTALADPAPVPEPVAEPAGSTALTEPAPAAEPVAEPASSLALGEPAPAPHPEPVVSGLSSTDSQAVLRVVNAWVTDWAAQDVNGYLSHYAANFKPDGDMSYSQWQQQRRIRLTRPTSIRIKISTPVVLPGVAGSAQVKFVQRYRSNTYNGNTRKRLTLVKTRQGWKITREKILR